MRQGAAIRKQYQPRPQCQQAALERQSASHSRQGEGRYQTHPRLHFLLAQWESRQSLDPLTTKDTKVHEADSTDGDFLRVPLCPLWLKTLLHSEQFHIKDQRRIRRDHAWVAFLAIGKL